MNLHIKEYLISEFEKLPQPEQKEVIDFINFLHSKKHNLNAQKPETTNNKIAKGKKEVLGRENEFFGMWKDREDMTDSVAWVDNLRKTQWAT